MIEGHPEPQRGADGPVPAFRLDPELVDAVTSGAADRPADAALADQVAVVLAWHAELPPELAGRLTRLVRHLGGDDALLRWLDEHPGRPRRVSRIYRFVGFLDGISASRAVVTALRERRERAPDPPGLERYLPPDTDAGTLASLAHHIESLLGRGRDHDATAVALAAVALLRDVLPRAADLDPSLRGLDEHLDRLGREIDDARDPG
jgi:hypothetical protein